MNALSIYIDYLTDLQIECAVAAQLHSPFRCAAYRPVVCVYIVGSGLFHSVSVSEAHIYFCNADVDVFFSLKQNR